MLQRQGASDRLLVNGMVSVKHLALLSSWQQSRYLHWFGPGREGDAHFLSGDCALITTASSLYVEAVARGIDVAVAPLPYYDDIYAPRAGETLPDGRSLWVLANSVNAAQEKLIARFVRYLLEPAVQREWVAKSGSLPMTRAAIDALREGGVFPPGLLAATQTRLSAARPRMARLKAIPARERFRLILGEEIEPVWTAHRAPKEALDRTVQRTDAAPEMRSR
jgi:sn-glycerol 3-phosphate transport system substrate-binding protein